MIEPLDVHLEAVLIDIWERVLIQKVAVPEPSAMRAVRSSTRLSYPLVYTRKVKVGSTLFLAEGNLLYVRPKIFVADRAFAFDLLPVRLKYLAEVR